MITAVLVVIFTTILYFAYWCISYKLRYRCLDHIPGPKSLPIFGSILEFGENCVDKLYNMNRIIKEYGLITKAWFGPNKLYIFVADPEIIEFFMSSQKYLTKSDDYIFLKPWLRNGLLVSTGSYWQTRRKIITPTFHFKILEEFTSVFNNEGEKFIKRLEKLVDKGTFDIYPYIQAYTMDVICETAMGTSIHAQENPDNEYVTAVKTLSTLYMERLFSPWKQFDVLYELSNSYKVYKKALNIVQGFTTSIIEKRREQLLLQSDKEIENTDDVGMKKRAALLEVLLRATVNGKPLSNDDISEEVDTFMFEGHDTTASGLGFAVYVIAKNQDVQEKIIEELKDIFADDMSRQPTIQDLNNMKYLEAVIKETLRLYPPVPLFGRCLEEDAYFKGTRFPKGVSIIFQIFAMHRQEIFFENAETFNPDRFLDDSIRKRNPFAYVPFSAGPRNCIGQKFAMYEMKAALCKILRHFELQPADGKNDLILSTELVLKANNGINIKVKNRKL